MLPKADYERGNVRMWNCDCLTLLPEIEAGSVDAVVTDPPYGIRHSSSKGASWENTTIAGDGDTSVRDRALDFSCLDGLPMAVFGTWKTGPIRDVRGCLVWDKGPASGMGDLSFPWKNSFELIYIRGNAWRGSRDEAVRRGGVVFSWESKGRTHPHEKPVWLIDYLLRKILDAHVILDPFMGSGTTGVACVHTGRAFMRVEIDPNYFAIACRRIDEAFDQCALFDRVPPAIRKTGDLFATATL